jgi:uncharacterized membrane protein
MASTRAWGGLAKEPALYFGLALLLAVIGFWPSFFAVLPSSKLPHLIHGFSATAWMALPILQVMLIRKRERKLHRRVGYASLLLAGVVVLSGLYVVQIMAFNNIANFRLLDVKFVWLDLTAMALFCVYLALAVIAARKRDFGMHVRLLACTAVIPLEASQERLLNNLFPALVPNYSVGLYASLLTMEAICIGVLIAEWRLRRIRWPFVSLLIYYLAMHITATPVAENKAFQAFCDWYGRFGGWVS